MIRHIEIAETLEVARDIRRKYKLGASLANTLEQPDMLSRQCQNNEPPVFSQGLQELTDKEAAFNRPQLTKLPWKRHQGQSLQRSEYGQATNMARSGSPGVRQKLHLYKKRC